MQSARWSLSRSALRKVENGEANLSDLWAVGDALAKAFARMHVVVIKSTVPVGTNARAMPSA